MKRTEIIAEFKKMSRKQQLALLKRLASLVEVETPRQRTRRLASLPTAEEMTGVIRTGNQAPTDAEVKQMYINHVVGKYSR